MFKNSRWSKPTNWLEKKVQKTEQKIKRFEQEALYQKQAHRERELKTEEALKSWRQYLKNLKAGKAV